MSSSVRAGSPDHEVKMMKMALILLMEKHFMIFFVLNFNIFVHFSIIL